VEPERKRHRIAVVIPTYERRVQVLAAIDSCLSQDRLPDEIIVVDGRSVDGTADAIRSRYGESVRVVERDNAGPAPARNAGIAATNCDIVAFLDSDDIWLPHHLTLIEEMFERFPDAVLVGTERNFDQERSEAPATAQYGDIAEQFLLCLVNPGHPTSLAVKRASLEAIGGFDDDMWFGEDTMLYLRLAFEGPMAMLSHVSFTKGKSDDSLLVSGITKGGYAPFLQESSRRIEPTIFDDRVSKRSDADAIRRAYKARLAIGNAFVAASSTPAGPELAEHLREAFDLAPCMRTLEWLEREVVAIGPKQHEAWCAFSDVWPKPFDSVAAEVRYRALSSRIRRREWRNAARTAAALVNPSGAVRIGQAVAERWSRKRPHL
jgi:glycosyltransferase involved in cell wall biosynthesis